MHKCFICFAEYEDEKPIKVKNGLGEEETIRRISFNGKNFELCVNCTRAVLFGALLRGKEYVVEDITPTFTDK